MLMSARNNVTNKLRTLYDRDKTKQAEMPYFHCSPSRKESFIAVSDISNNKIIIR